jgi:hypothetical protein
VNGSGRDALPDLLRGDGAQIGEVAHADAC